MKFDLKIIFYISNDMKWRKIAAYSIFYLTNLSTQQNIHMNLDKTIYWISTGLMCLLFLFSASMYFFKYSEVQVAFETLGFPIWIIYPLATAKVLGVIAVLSKQSKTLKEWAYAGFFFDTLLAAGAHYMAADGGTSLTIVAMVLILISYIYDGKLYR